MKDYLTFDKMNPKHVGVDNDKLLELDKIIPLHYKNLHGIIILRHDQLVFEKYYNGYTKDDRFHVASVTKSFISALLGIAIDKGYIKDLNQKVLDFFPEYKCHPKEIQKKAVTLKDLLTMRAPYAFGAYDPYEKLCMQKDWAKFSLDMLGKNGNIGTFKYSSCGAHLLSIILTKATQKSAREFANEYLFPYIGIEQIPDNMDQTFDFDGLFGKNLKGWGKDPSGYSTGGWGLTLTTRDMARFGSLYLHVGVVNSQQVISKDWVKQSISGIPLDKDLHMSFNEYGYLWCVCHKDNLFAYMALGDGGNMICCIPEKDLIIAISSEAGKRVPDRMKLVEKYILPSII